MADILYTLEGHLYLNITNRCPCDCVFCIRQNGDGVGSAETLWHQRDPSTDEVMAALREFDFSPYTEAVFCGYGEPTVALDTLLAAAKYLKDVGLNVRLNTNGLSDLIHGKPTAAMLKGLVDTVSISLNAPTAARYNDVTRPSFGERAFEAMLSYAAECKQLVPNVVFTVVDVITPDEIEACRAIADRMGIPLRVRARITG